MLSWNFSPPCFDLDIVTMDQSSTSSLQFVKVGSSKIVLPSEWRLSTNIEITFVKDLQ